MKGFPSNSYNVFEVVSFGALCGAIFNILCVKKHLTYMSLMREDLLSFFENSYEFHFLTKKYEKIQIFLYSYLSTSEKYYVIDTQNIPWCNSLSGQLRGILPYPLHRAKIYHSIIKVREGHT
jgi:hypothetical protein